MYANDPKDIIDCLDKPRPNNDPAVCFFVEYRLREMHDSDEGEENYEEDCRAFVRAEWPFCVDEVRSCYRSVSLM